MQYVVTLVHGTWAQNAAWTSERSRFCKQLKERLGGTVTFRPFSWSGGNSARARRRAAADLRNFLDAGFSAYPTATHAVVAHSHGGNIALDALRSASLRARVDAVVCLSTPFLHLRARDLGKRNDKAVYALTACVSVFLFVLFVLFSHRAFAAQSPGESLWNTFLGLLGLGLFLAGIFAAFGWILILLPLTEHVQNLVNADLPTVSRLLVIRAPGDEASDLLIASHFAGWLVTTVWKLAAAVADKLQSLTGSIARFWKDHPVGTYIVAVVATDWYFWQGTGHSPGDAISVLLFGSLAGALIGFLVYKSVPILLMLPAVTTTVIAGLLLVPFCVFSGLTLLPVSPGLALLAGVVDVSIEAAPPGRCTLLQLGGVEPTGPLMHAATHEDPRAIRAAADWISAAVLRHHPPAPVNGPPHRWEVQLPVDGITTSFETEWSAGTLQFRFQVMSASASLLALKALAGEAMKPESEFNLSLVDQGGFLVSDIRVPSAALVPVRNNAGQVTGFSACGIVSCSFPDYERAEDCTIGWTNLNLKEAILIAYIYSRDEVQKNPAIAGAFLESRNSEEFALRLRALSVSPYDIANLVATFERRLQWVPPTCVGDYRRYLRSR